MCLPGFFFRVRGVSSLVLALVLGWGLALIAAGAVAAELRVEPERPATEGRPVGESFVVNRFRFVGNTVIPEAKLALLVAPLTNRPLTLLELERARIAVTLAYVTNGYINSGAWIDSRPDDQGVVEVRIMEGRLTEIRVHSNRWTRASFYQRRLASFQEQPLRVTDLRDRLQVWRARYPLEQVNGELRPGTGPGEGLLDLTVRERRPYQFGVQYANDKPPSTGAEQVTVIAQTESLTRSGDRLALSYGVVRGGSPGLRDSTFLGPDDLSVSYTVPVTSRDTALGAHYSRSSASVVEARFAELDITSDSEVYGVSLTQPLLRRPRDDLAVSLTAERKGTRSFLLGEPYSLSPGSIDGESIVSALRLGLQFVDHGPRHVLAGRCVVSAGVDALEATRQDSGPDGRFVSVTHQIKYVERLAGPSLELVLRGFGQWTPDPLLAIEQAAVGGASTLRGYRENTLVRDCALLGTLELNLVPWRDREGRSVVRLVPFASIGTGWNVDRPTGSPREISSTGIGVVVSPCKRFEASLFWGHAFRDLDYAETDLQDHGIHFSISAWAF